MIGPSWRGEKEQFRVVGVEMCEEEAPKMDSTGAGDGLE